MNFPLENKASKRWVFLCLAAIFIFQAPYFILGENAHILVHDNLDSVLSTTKMLLDSDMVFAKPTTTIEQVMGGLPRSSFPGYDLSLLFFQVFGMYMGYAVNKLFMALIAFAGMYLLLSRFVQEKQTPSFISPLVALIFSMLPFWSFTISVAGLPLVMYALLNLRFGNTQLSNWLYIVLYGFYSSLVLTGIFLFLIIGFVFLDDMIRKKKFGMPLFIGSLLLVICYLISHYPIFYSMFFSEGVVSHRTEFVSAGQSLAKSAKEGIALLLNGQYHAHSLHQTIAFPIGAGLIWIWFDRKLRLWQVLLVLFLVLTSALYGVLTWEAVSDIKQKLMSVVPVQLQRFHFLHPVFWYVLFCVVLIHVHQKLRFGNIITPVLLTLQLCFVLWNHELLVNRSGPTFKEFYAESQFEAIKKTIGKIPSAYRTVSIGIHPSIAQYNGLYTLDGYMPDYPLDYKHHFRKIIATELDKSQHLHEYFDYWGSRCYAFSSELGSDIPLKRIGLPSIHHLEFDFEQMKTMNGRFILSATTIDTLLNPALMYRGVFHSDTAEQDIVLYELR